MEKEIDAISKAAGKLLGAFVQSIRQFETETRQSRNDLFQQLRESGPCCARKNRAGRSRRKGRERAQSET